jgi:NADH-quinone oxidoreductase subunit N
MTRVLVEAKETYMVLDSIFLLMPEVVLVLVAIWILLGDAFAPQRRSTWPAFAAIGLLISAAFLAMQVDILWEQGTGPHTSGPLTIDLFSHLMQGLILVVGLLLVLVSSRSSAYKQPAEYLGSLLILIAGLMTVCVANELVLLFVSLELVSIPTYILLFIGQRAGKSGANGASEATVKYFFLSILSSALLLYGFSFLYGIAGSTDLAGIRFALADSTSGSMASYLAPVALVLVIAGLAFKLTIVPFHFYAPDVFQGTTHANAALLAVVPKIAGFVALVRVVYAALPGSEHMAWHLLFVFALLTMTFGNLLALWQKNIRRMMAYSSIAHAGYMLIGVTVALAVASGDAMLNRTLDGLSATVFYLVVYSVATIGTFATLSYLSGTNRQINTVDELAGAASSHPCAAAAFSVCMFSLAGVPIMAGFWGKFSLFAAALGVSTADDPGMTPLRLWFMALAVIGVVNAAVAAAYYLRLVAVAYFKPQEHEAECEGGVGAGAAMCLSAAAVLLVGFLPSPLLWATNGASRSVQSVLDHARSDHRRENPGVPESDDEPAGDDGIASRTYR